MLKPHFQRLVNDVTDIKATSIDTLSKLSNDSLAWSPSPDRWSIAQILLHLNMIGEEFAAEFEREISNATPLPKDSNEDVRFSRLELKVIQSLGPGGKVKLPVPPRWIPAQPENPRATVLPAFQRLQDKFGDVFRKASSVDLSRSKTTSPANKLFTFRTLVFMEGMVAHQRYHWGQIDAILHDPGFPN